MNKKLENKEVTPNAAPKTKPKARAPRTRLADTAPIEQWDERDIYFDDQGRVIIRNQALGRRIQAAMDDGPVTIIVPPPIRTPPLPPPPVDTMCNCKRDILVRQQPRDDVREAGALGQQLRGYA